SFFASGSVALYIFLYSINYLGSPTSEGIVVVGGLSPVAVTDEDFVCATLDWWPPEKCDYGTCAWDHASILNLDLKNPLLVNAVKAFSPLKIRLGGTLQDKVMYQTEDKSRPCTPFFSKNPSLLFGFSQGCLPLTRWDQLHSFFRQSGALVIFGLNALHGKSIHNDNTATGPWDPSNAASLIKYTVNNGYNVYGWELGNELSGTGIGVRISSDSYASDTIALHDLIHTIYEGVDLKPLIIAPGGFFDPTWYSQFLSKTTGSLSAITHHIYNLGPGSDAHLMDRILNPDVLDGGAGVFRNLRDLVRGSGSSVTAWVGESGGAYNSGRNGVTNAFVFSFWYLDQLGLASYYDHKVYCRQTLIGGNYGLLNTTTFAPNPDFYSALLWHRLMGPRVLSATFNVTNKVRAYAHCAKRSLGISLLLVNIDGNNSYDLRVEHDLTTPRRNSRKHIRLHRAPKWSHVKQQQLGEVPREEYHLTPLDGNIQSRVVLLNGKELIVDSSNQIPVLEPVQVNSSDPIKVDPYSIVFVHFPSMDLPAC
ncbi:hypothetical protein M569_07189, partial [Genlisea aurea]